MGTDKVFFPLSQTDALLIPRQRHPGQFRGDRLAGLIAGRYNQLPGFNATVDQYAAAFHGLEGMYVLRAGLLSLL